MRCTTELMRSILTNKMAQEIIGYVSPIYGNSYVGLWLYQVIGTALEKVCDIAVKMRGEGNPATADMLLDLWESHYNVPKDSSLTKQARQMRIINRIQIRGPCSPARMEAAVSASLGGATVEITENVSKNTFKVNIREVVDSINPAVAVIERMKPAHLVYKIQVATQTVTDAELKTAIAMTQAELYRVEVLQ